MTDSTTPSPLVSVRVATDDDRKPIGRLRYDVYVGEGFIAAADFPEGLEFDCFDDYSHPVVATVGAGSRVVGTSRLILGSGGPLPIQDPEHHGLDTSNYKNIGEISRLCVRPDFQDGRISLGLYRCLFHLLDVYSLDAVCAVVGEEFFETLCRIGFPFKKVGPVRDHMGPTVPCVCITEEVIPALQNNQHSNDLGITALFEQPFTGQLLI